MEFEGFPKLSRLSRTCIITEKIDGTNAQIFINENGEIRAGSRTRWITPQDDNFGFASWVEGNKKELLELGPGRHFGEWWGHGIQRGYGLEKGDRRFSLFNVQRWCLFGEAPKRIETADPRIEKYQDVLPPCCSLVPEMYRGKFLTDMAEMLVDELRAYGSLAAPEFMKPEGIVVFHVAANIGFKKTIDNDGQPKSLVN